MWPVCDVLQNLAAYYCWRAFVIGQQAARVLPVSGPPKAGRERGTPARVGRCARREHGERSGTGNTAAARGAQSASARVRDREWVCK